MKRPGHKNFLAGPFHYVTRPPGEETGLETCWRDRHNLVEIYDVTKMLFSRVGHYSFFSVQKRCKSDCPKVLVSSLLKPMPPYTLSLRTSACCLPAKQVGRRKVGTYTFTITKSEARKNLLGFQILMFCNWVFLVFFLAKWHWVLGTRQRDVRERASFSQADLSTFRFDVVYLLITLSWNTREAQMSSNSVNMHL